MPDLIAEARRHLRDILAIAFEHPPDGVAVVVYDSRSVLSRILTEAYRISLPSAAFLDFDSLPPESILSAFAPLRTGDLVVLVQSGNFRLEAFRLRVELFKRGLKVIEHPHLERMTGAEAAWYVDSLAYDPSYYRGVGGALRERIDAAPGGIVDSGGERLVFSGAFEPAKLNVGDYRGMKNTGGQFPIGEVFTEARDLEAVNGRVRIFIFADLDFMVNRPDRPITLVVSRGRVVDTLDSSPDFEKVLAAIRTDEGEVWVRELGFGMNRAFNRERVVRDIGTLERMCGIHLSLGAKHAIYNKPAFSRRHGRHHVDVFAITQSVSLDGSDVFGDGEWIVR